MDQCVFLALSRGTKNIHEQNAMYIPMDIKFIRICRVRKFVNLRINSGLKVIEKIQNGSHCVVEYGFIFVALDYFVLLGFSMR